MKVWPNNNKSVDVIDHAPASNNSSHCKGDDDITTNEEGDGQAEQEPQHVPLVGGDRVRSSNGDTNWRTANYNLVRNFSPFDFDPSRIISVRGWGVDRPVFLLRLVVLSVLGISMALTATAVFQYTRSVERNDFEETFDSDASKLFDAVGRSLYTTLGALDTFVVSMVALARCTGQEWPFVTIPDYGVQVGKMRARAGVSVVNQFNLVSSEQLEKWETYSVANDAWVGEGLEVQKHDINYHGKLSANISASDLVGTKVLGPDGTAKSGPGPFLPNWQSSPVMPNRQAYNWDFSAVYSNPVYLEETLGYKRVVIAEVYNMPAEKDEDRKTAADDLTEAIQDFIAYLDPRRDPTEPLSDILYPILNDAADSITYNRTIDSKPVGILIATVFWSELIKDVLPEGTHGIIFVFENPCHQTFTYQIDGAAVMYLGRGDLHDETYDSLGKKVPFQDLALSYTSSRSVYTGLPLSGKGCPFTLSVYPSRDNEESFMSNNPFVYAITAVVIFSLTVFLFVSYDFCVERRQQMLLRKAMQSAACVSLLEEKVQERTQKLEATNGQLEEANIRIMKASAAQLHHFACMSHEIRTPLNCIVGLTGLLLESDLNSMQKEFMKMIISSSDLLLTVVNDVLDYSKLESGNVDIEIRRRNLQDILNSVVHAIEAKAQQNNVALRTDFAVEVGNYLQTDGRRLQQILYNLLGNAIKFSNPGNQVELHLSLRQECKAPRVDDTTVFYSPMDDSSFEGTVSVFRKSTEGVLCFSVKNYDKGISMEDMSKVFKPFQQAKSETDDVYGGTGLGLAITTRLVQGLGGRISAESKGDEWCLFSVEFPSSTTEPSDIQGLSEKLNEALILFVCNQPPVVEQVSEIFRRYVINFSCFDNMQQLQPDFLPSGYLSPFAKKHLICLVQEDLYDQKTFECFCNSMMNADVRILCFGPNHNVQDAQGHFRSLVRLLPCVFIGHLGSIVSSTACPRPESSISVQDNNASTVVSNNDAGAAPYQNLRVLAAEDNLINQKVLFRMLKRLGVDHVELVDNGQEAVNREASNQYDVILMDLQMPIMGGIEACQHIKRRQNKCPQRHPKAKIIFVTAHAAMEFEKQCREAGGEGFLSKPYNIRDMEKCFQKLYTIFQMELENSARSDGYGTFTG